MSHRERPILPLYWSDDPFIAAQLLEDEWLETTARQREEEATIGSESVDEIETYY